MTKAKPKAQADRAAIDDAAAADAEAKAKADAEAAQAADAEAAANLAKSEDAAKAEAEAQAQQDLDRKLAEAEHIRDGGIDFAIEQLAMVLGVDPAAVNWDAATETEEGDVRAVLGNVLTARFGDDWADLPDPAAIAAKATAQAERLATLTGSNGDDPPLTEAEAKVLASLDTAEGDAAFRAGGAAMGAIFCQMLGVAPPPGEAFPDEVAKGILTARFGADWATLPRPVDPNAADAEAEAARAAPAEPLRAQDLIDWVKYIEAHNNETLRPALLADLAGDPAMEVAPIEPHNHFRLKIAGLEVTSGPGAEIALRSWCETARVKVLRGEAV